MIVIYNLTLIKKVIHTPITSELIAVKNHLLTLINKMQILIKVISTIGSHKSGTKKTMLLVTVVIPNLINKNQEVQVKPGFR